MTLPWFASRAARRALVLGCALAALTAAPRPACAQAFPGRPAAEDLYNFGAIGAAGLPDGSKLRVRQVLEGPAQAAGLREGDLIVEAAGRELGADPLLALWAAIEEVEGSRKRRPLSLTVERGGERAELELALPRLGEHSRRCPEKCKKCRKVVEAGLGFLARTQAGDGCFPTDLGGKTGKVVVTALGGLAFLAAGAPPDAAPLARATRYVLSHCNVAEDSPFGGALGGAGGNWNQTNWELAYGLMFLAEMCRATRNPELKAKCAELVQALQNTQEASGGWAHGPGGPNALGYLELEIVSNYALLGMGAAQRLGLELDEGKLAKALTWIEGTASADGGVGYSHREGQKGFGDPGRTAGALVAFAALGQARHPFFGKMAGFYGRELPKLIEGHVSPAMHLLAGAMAARLLGKQAWRAYVETYRPYIMGFRRPDGSFASTPTHESQQLRSNTDLTVGPRWTTATYVLILSLVEDELPLLLGGDVEAAPRRSRPRTGGG